MSLKEELFLAALRSKTAEKAVKGTATFVLGKVADALPLGKVQAWAAGASGRPVKVPR